MDSDGSTVPFIMFLELFHLDLSNGSVPRSLVLIVWWEKDEQILGVFTAVGSSFIPKIWGWALSHADDKHWLNQWWQRRRTAVDNVCVLYKRWDKLQCPRGNLSWMHKCELCKYTHTPYATSNSLNSTRTYFGQYPRFLITKEDCTAEPVCTVQIQPWTEAATQ